jgi:hypothetical protein
MLRHMSLEILDSSLVSRGEGWMSSWVGEEYVMMSAETGTCISLSETGGRIWELVEQPCVVRALCDELTQEYQADAATIRDDVFTFLNRMRAESAVVISR